MGTHTIQVAMEEAAAEVVPFCSLGEHDRIFSRRGLIDGLKNPEKYFLNFGKKKFHFPTQKIQKWSKTLKK